MVSFADDAGLFFQLGCYNPDSWGGCGRELSRPSPLAIRALTDRQKGVKKDRYIKLTHEDASAHASGHI